MRNQLQSLLRGLTIAALTAPLFQLACTPDQLARSFATEVVTAATQFTFDVSQTVFSNLLGL